MTLFRDPNAEHPPIYPDEHGDWAAANRGAKAQAPARGMTMKKLRIVNGNGDTATYQGKPLVFDESERWRADAILWMLRREAVNGADYTLVEGE